MSIDQNLGEHLQVIEVLAPIRRTATATGSAIDLRDYVGDVKFILSTSAGGGADHTLNVKLTECGTSGGSYTDVAGAAFTEVTNAADATESLTVSADSLKRYVKAVATIAGTEPTFDMALVAVGVKQVRA
jgi:hypothetical protein